MFLSIVISVWAQFEHGITKKKRNTFILECPLSQSDLISLHSSPVCLPSFLPRDLPKCNSPKTSCLLSSGSPLCAGGSAVQQLYVFPVLFLCIHHYCSVSLWAYFSLLVCITLPLTNIIHMVDTSKQLLSVCFLFLSPYQQLPALNKTLCQLYLFDEHPES